MYRCDCAVKASDAAFPFNPLARRSLSKWPVVQSDFQRTENAADWHSWGDSSTAHGHRQRRSRSAAPADVGEAGRAAAAAAQNAPSPLRGRFQRRSRGSRCATAPPRPGAAREGAAAHRRSRPAGLRGAEPCRAGWGRGATAVMENFRLLHLLRVPRRSPPLPGFHSPSHAGVGGGGAEASAVVAVAASRRPAPSRPPGPATVAGQSHRPPACLCPGEPRGSVSAGMVVRDSLDGASRSRVAAATTAPGRQRGSRPSHPPRALDAAEEGSEGDNSGGVKRPSGRASSPLEAGSTRLAWQCAAAAGTGAGEAALQPPAPLGTAAQWAPTTPVKPRSECPALHSKAPLPTSTEGSKALQTCWSDYLKKRKQDVLFPPLSPTGSLSWITSLSFLFTSRRKRSESLSAALWVRAYTCAAASVKNREWLQRGAMMGQWHLVPCHAPSSWETPAPEPGARRGVERGRHILGEPVGTGCCSHSADAALCR